MIRNMEILFDQVRMAVLKKNYTFFEDGDYNLNFIWERTNDTITNYFTDRLHVLYYENSIPKIITIRATTKPGYNNAIDSPVTYEGVTGTAIIVPGQYKSAWKFTEGDPARKYPFNYPYFEQIKGINYWRDYNKDKIIDEVQEQNNRNFRTHWHAMSPKGVFGHPVNNWSLGCMGAEEPEWVKIIEITRKARDLWGDVFTGTIIEKGDLGGNKRV
jgi:hypothetical protein